MSSAATAIRRRGVEAAKRLKSANTRFSKQVTGQTAVGLLTLLEARHEWHQVVSAWSGELMKNATKALNQSAKAADPEKALALKAKADSFIAWMYAIERSQDKLDRAIRSVMKRPDKEYSKQALKDLKEIGLGAATGGAYNLIKKIVRRFKARTTISKSTDADLQMEERIQDNVNILGVYLESLIAAYAPSQAAIPVDVFSGPSLATAGKAWGARLNRIRAENSA